MTLRAVVRGWWDKIRTHGKCQAVALGTAGCDLLGWYHYHEHCHRSKGHIDGWLGYCHQSRQGGVWS